MSSSSARSDTAAQRANAEEWFVLYERPGALHGDGEGTERMLVRYKPLRGSGFALRAVYAPLRPHKGRGCARFGGMSVHEASGRALTSVLVHVEGGHQWREDSDGSRGAPRDTGVAKLDLQLALFASSVETAGAWCAALCGSGGRAPGQA